MILRRVRLLKLTKKRKIPSSTKKIVHSNVKLLMELKQKSISALAEEAGVDEDTIKKARAHKTIEMCRLESLQKIATALGVKLKNLFDRMNLEDVL